MTHWDPRFENVVRGHLPWLDGAVPLGENDALFELGLSSLGAVQLLYAIEDEFGIAFPDELLGGDIFVSASRLWSVVAGLMACN